MTTFGTSAYLKLLALNPQPRDTEIRKRLGARKGGYDFHKAMRRVATEYASQAVDWHTTEARLRAISQAAERQSATSAAQALMSWVNGRAIRLVQDADQQVASPNGIYSVKFSPDFEIDLGGTATRIHIWNTIRPAINLREAIGTLGLFVPDDNPQSIGVLSLRTGELFVPTNAESSRDLARMLSLDIERRFDRVAAEENARRPEDRGSERRTRL
ncbi:hypothetical protein [Aminobacter sp. LjRoot7]|uniref:hypothetical protein n=1 Tax=Aminobacter sp. LjRoot7 TaxID=3342335 RepID=UPI003ECDD92A